jgi:peptidoglycan/LPS O-acetylase OafA/YrhL
VGLHASHGGYFARPLRWLGDLSYSVYLLHPFASLVATSLIAVQSSPRLAFAFGLSLTIVFAALGRYLVEQPAIHWGKRLTRTDAAPVPSLRDAHWLSRSAE